VSVEGTVEFAGVKEDSGFLELSSGPALAQVRVSPWSWELSKRFTGSVVRIEGVCEGVIDQKGTLTPGLIWAGFTNSISVVQQLPTNTSALASSQPAQTVLTNNPAMEGFFSTRGVVTFSDRVLGSDLIYLQEGFAAMRVHLENGRFKNQFKPGRWMDLGGALEPGKNIATITPLAVTDSGWHAMPLPIDQPLLAPVSGNREGRWTEIQGMVHSVNSNGTLTVYEKNGAAYFWIGNTPSNRLARYVDAKVRARGVLTLELLDAPVLLVPSEALVNLEEPPPTDPFGVPQRSIAEVLSQDIDLAGTHKVRVAGEVTWQDAQSFFIQDASGGIRVRKSFKPVTEVGRRVEVLAFPRPNGFSRSLSEAVVRFTSSAKQIVPKELDLSQGLSANERGTLVKAKATVLSCMTNGPNQLIKLEQQQCVFVASLALANGYLNDIPPGSTVLLTGVCDIEAVGSTCNLLLRTPADVVVLSGPPWWTWKQTAALSGTLLTVAFGALLWVYLLRRRLERQQAAQLAFSRQVLERVEEERRRIAANLHDSLGQVLLGIKNHALLAMQLNPTEPQMQDRLKEISGTTSQAIDEVRQITHGLRPYQLDRLGLTQAIRALVNRAENGSILFAAKLEDIDGLFDKDAEIHIYRVVQEAINNVVKHSGATEAAVVLKKRAAVITLSIRDNGCGFDPAKPSSELHEAGFGLRGMTERVRILEGTLAVDSRAGHGTSLTIEVPLKTK
jgi:signal transduction histidine kinase